MKYELSHDKRNITDSDLLDDMRRVASEKNESILKQATYKDSGIYGVTTVIRRFGSWNKAVETAGLDKTVDRNISNEDLFEALYELWVRIGSQPNYSDVQKPNCHYHVATYERRFGSWRAALEAFVSYMNEKDTPSPPPKDSKAVIKRTPRSINLRLRFKVISRDNFRCASCGASPAKNPEVELHVDHIIPYSKGGETLEENLRALCSKCNLGKSDLIPD